MVLPFPYLPEGMPRADPPSKAGLSASSIIGYENGSMVPGVDKAYAIAQALGCTPNDLMGWNTDEAA